MYQYSKVELIAQFLRNKINITPKVGIICGSGLGGLADRIENPQTISYETIPDFPRSTVPGHAGCLVFGYLGHIPVVCMKGRLHSFEGYPSWMCALPVRVFKLLGIDTLIVTNAAGGLNPNFNPGDIMIIEDHIGLPGLIGESPLRGENDDRWGPRFPAMGCAYDKQLRSSLQLQADKLGLKSILRKGIYLMAAGPAYETPAESRMIRMLGADAVGMSTVHEVTSAVHSGIKVLGISLITNMVILDADSAKSVNHEEVLEASNKRAKDLEKLVRETVLHSFPKPEIPEKPICKHCKRPQIGVK